ncbi:methyltransferase domain-containing protein [Rhodobacterales bacterium HKCCE2091]|nr:methyltransferase domain-containing protein [Rhodobacterales bacterium HKCCE2091]
MPMAETYLDKVYTVRGDEETRALYDDWAGSYDAEVGGAGYATPGRVADALAGLVAEADRGRPLFDFGCGTGLGGAALAARGFTDIHGCDMSPGMLAEAGKRGIYADLTASDGTAPKSLGRFAFVTAIGVISAGAALAPLLPALFDAMAPGALLAFSYNGHTLEDAVYMDTLGALLDRPDATLEFSEDGPHLPDLDLPSRVMVIRKS